MRYLITFIALINIAASNIGYVIAYTNNTTPIIESKFDWPEDQKALYHSLIGSSAMLGMTIGAVTGG